MRTLITGASSGLGAEMARQFAAAGHDLALCARRLDRLEALRDEILAASPQRTVLLRRLDVDDHDDVFAVFPELAARLGDLDRVIVNAGLGKGAPLGTGRFEANRQTITTNLVSGLAQCEAAMEHFRAAGRRTPRRGVLDVGDSRATEGADRLRGLEGRDRRPGRGSARRDARHRTSS